MADSSNLRENSARLRKNLSKLAFRNKERVMRSFGRTEETRDEIFDHYVTLINKQQIQMQKLQRDMKQYLQALKAMSLAQKAFYSSLSEVYDEGWEGKDVVLSCSKRSELLYDDVFARFQSEILELLQNHLTEYQKCKIAIEKRGRKLVDYDAAKRAVQVLESAKKPDHAKIEKSKESLRQARDVYEELNNFLHKQLPSLHDSRLPICVNVFSSICESEGMFSSEVTELRTKLNNVLSNLKSSFDKGEYHIQRMQTPLDNGRLTATTGSPRTSTSVHNKISPPLPRSSSGYGHSESETPGENGFSKRSDDPSTHEYVNLQVGTMPDTVKPVSEDEESRSDEISNNRTIEESTYLTPNVPFQQEDAAYIMASDISYSAQRSEPVGMSLRPRPAVRCHVFRNPSDRRDVRPPIPKPLPRTLSAPPGRRPDIKRHAKGPAFKRYNRAANLNYTDIHRPYSKHKATNMALEDRPKQGQRPASMFMPSTAVGLSVYSEDKTKAKDDGSGSADAKKSKNTQGEEKAQKGIFGRLGLKRFRSTKSSSPASLSTSKNDETTSEKSAAASSQSKEEGVEVSKPVFATMAGAPAVPSANRSVDKEELESTEAVRSNEQATSVDGYEESEYSEIGSDFQQESSMKQNAVKADKTTTEIPEEEVMNSTTVKYAKINKKKPLPEVPQATEASVADENAVSKSGDNDVIDQDEAREVEAEIRRVSIENDPVYSVAVDFKTQSEGAPTSGNDAFNDSEDFKPFGSFNDMETSNEQGGFDAFGAPTTNVESFGSNGGFNDSFVAPNQLELEGFGSEPFQSVESADSALDGDDSVFDPNSPISPDHFSAVSPATGDFNGQGKDDTATHTVSASLTSDFDVRRPVSVNVNQHESAKEAIETEAGRDDFYEDMTQAQQTGESLNLTSDRATQIQAMASGKVPYGDVSTTVGKENKQLESQSGVTDSDNEYYEDMTVTPVKENAQQGHELVGKDGDNEYYEDMSFAPKEGNSQFAQNVMQQSIGGENFQQDVIEIIEGGHHTDLQTGSEQDGEFYEDMTGTLQRNKNEFSSPEKSVLSKEDENSNDYYTDMTVSVKMGTLHGVSDQVKDEKWDSNRMTSGLSNDMAENITGKSQIASNAATSQADASDHEELYEPVIITSGDPPGPPSQQDRIEMHQAHVDSGNNPYEDIPEHSMSAKGQNNCESDISDNDTFYEDVAVNPASNHSVTISSSESFLEQSGSVSQGEFPIPSELQHNEDDHSEIPPIYEEPPREDFGSTTPVPVESIAENKIPTFPPNYLFTVQALYQYRSSDDDELSFGKGEIIHIIEHPDPEEQDDGWQMGVRLVDWEQKGDVSSCMGVFPENFTKRIEI